MLPPVKTVNGETPPLPPVPVIVIAPEASEATLTVPAPVNVIVSVVPSLPVKSTCPKVV